MLITPGNQEAISRAIKGSGKTYREIAKAMGVSDTTVSNYALGVRKPAAGNLVKLARVLGIEVRELMKG